MRSSEEGNDFNQLKKAGFELDAPEDDFSAQPDSGGRIGGNRGVNEYGIAGDVATEDSLTPFQGSTAPITGELTVDEDVDYLKEKLNLVPALDSEDVQVAIVKDKVILTGNVPSLEIKDQISKVAEEILEEREFENRVIVRT